jgi:hypothetical protein
LLALDGTGHYSSAKIGCKECLEKTSSSGEVTYSHQMLGAAIVHPDLKVVLPLMPEPIIKQDGQKKNDCERNAAKRFLAQLRKDHPHLEFVVVEDALSSNAPHIEELRRHNLRFLLGAKEGDHAFLFAEVQRRLEEDDRVTFLEVHRAGVTYLYWIMCDVPLNASNPDLLVTFVDYTEVRDDRTLRFSWVTDLPVTRDNVPEVVRGGRARWKIENETFNTLKNQGYHFEHNFGHGQQHLSVVFAMLMMLAFLVDQVQQLSCPLFEAALARATTRRALWEAQRRLFFEFKIQSLRQLWEALAYGHEPCALKVLDSS